MGIRVRAGRGCALALALAVASGAPAAHLAAAEAALAPDPEAAADAPELAPAPEAPTAAAVLPPRTAPGLEALGLGLREWLSERLAAGGLDVLDRARVENALRSAAAAPIHGADAPRLGEPIAAGTLIFCEIWHDAGEIDLRLRAHSTRDGALRVGVREKGQVAELPALATAALIRLGRGLGLAERQLAGTTPRLSDWTAFGRARERLEAGDLASAWRELATATGPTAERLRAEIDARPAPPATRSRLSNASNRSDPNWLRVREALRAPHDAETVLAGADAAMAHGEADRALRFYEKAAEIEPMNAAAHLGRGDSLVEAGRAAEAPAAFARAAELLPGDPRPFRALSRIETLPSDERAAHLLRAAALHAARFETEAARAVLAEADRQESGRSGAALRSLAALEARLGNASEARVAWEQALEIGPRDVAALVGLGDAAAASGDAETAATAFREALAQDGTHVAALIGLGNALAAEGLVEAALAPLEQAVSLAPGDVAARRALARVHARRGQAERALALLEVSGVRDRDRVLLLRDAAEIRQEVGELPRAEATLREAIALEPEDPDLRGMLATLLEAGGDTAGAQAEREQAQRMEAAVDAPGHAAPAKAAEDRSPEVTRGDSLAVASFEALAHGFPLANPGSGRPLDRVLLLGVREQLRGVGAMRRWLHPWRPDLSALDLALLEALVGRFPIEETPDVPAETASQIQALLQFSDARETIAAVNEGLRSDAAFVARVVNHGSAAFWAREEPVLEVRLLGGATAPGVFIVAHSLRLEPGSFMRWNPIAFLPWIATVVGVGMLAARKRGGKSAPRPASALGERRAAAPPMPSPAVQAPAPRRDPSAERPAEPAPPARPRYTEPESPPNEAPGVASHAAGADPGDSLAAVAERLRAEGDLGRAAEAFEAVFDYDSAIDCHRRAGNAARALELLEKTGRDFEAAQIALELGDAERGIRNLRNVDLRDPDYERACRMLAERVGDAADASLSDEKPIEMLDLSNELEDTPLERAETRTEPEPEPASPPPAPAAESRYEILSEVGRGGMGVVYQARDRRLGRIVALKRLPDELSSNPTAVKLFLREARAAAALNHPNIVTLFDADQDPDGYYLTMEFLDGLPVDQILEKRGRVSPRDAIRLATQTATGLEYAHEHGVVHRDVKTSNLFFTRDRSIKIMDFGLAKMAAEVRRSAVIGGTPYYMAPEQASGEDVDLRADLYAFGVTLFELLTGTLPFKNGDITWHHQNTAPPDPRTLAADLPDALAELILQLLEKDPAARPVSAAETNERLEEIALSLDVA